MFNELNRMEQLCLKLSYIPLSIQKKWQCINYFQNHPEENIFTITMEKLVANLAIQKNIERFNEYWQYLSAERLADLLATQHFITYFSDDYPYLLKQSYQPPLVLYYVGNSQLLNQPQIAFVGSRQASDYSLQILEHLIPDLVTQGFGITSGLAKGVDMHSHLSAMNHQGHTIGVLGCGLDICYPKEVFSTYERMKQQQLIISEYPQGTKVKRYHFPMRNRIIASLTQGVCVIEAKEKSGSLITAQIALDEGRQVFIVPGEILSGRFTGGMQLIQEGAKCILKAEDILDELSYLKNHNLSD